MRLSEEELQDIVKKYGKLYSWSRINCFMTSPYEYFIKYIRQKKEDIDNCAYAPMGGMCHSIIEKFYENQITYKDMIDEFEDSWITAIDIADLKFDRNDETKNNNIKEKYKEDLCHFFKNHNKIQSKVAIEKFLTIKIDNYVLQGYIDAIYKDSDGYYNIIDWKTSTKYSGKDAEEKCGQLIVYAIGLNQRDIPMNKIKICWNFLKYTSIRYEQANGTVKTRDVERCKIGECLQANAKMWLKKMGYCEQLDDYLKELIDTNDIKCLPKNVQEKYVINDCYVYVPLTEKLIDRWINKIVTVINDIELREKDYRETKNDKIFWDSDESVKAQSYYFSTLCGYSPNLHLPYKKYLERLEAASGNNIFDGVGKEIKTESLDNNVICENSSDNNVDLSWLDNI